MYELTIDLDMNSRVPLYEQIYNHVKNEIKKGRIECKAKLPSTRALAEYLQISRSTVDMAYTQLVSEGYVEAVPYRGYYVCEISLLYNIGSVEEKSKIEKIARSKANLIDFSPWGIDLDCFPFNAWRKITKALLSSDNKDLFVSGASTGELKLRNTLSAYLYEARGVRCNPERIIIGAGMEYLLMLINQLFCEKPVIAMENPTYMQAYNVFKKNGNTIIPVNMDKSGMKMNELNEANADIAYVMPSHQFPLGIVMPIKRRMELLEWANASDKRYIIEDDYDSEFRYLGKPIPALQGVGNSQKVIYMGTFSKSVAPSIRLGYMVLPENLYETFKQEIGFYSQTVSKMDQLIVNEFISKGYFERHLNKMRSNYKAKHDLLVSILKEWKGKVSISGENSGLHILINVNNSMSEKKLISSARDEGVRVHGISEYFIEKQSDYKGTILLGFANLNEDEIREGIKKLEKAWRLV